MPFYRNRDYSKVLALQEKERKKYISSCHKMRRDFTLLVYSVDGIVGQGANMTEKHLPLYLSATNGAETTWRLCFIYKH